MYDCLTHFRKILFLLFINLFKDIWNIRRAKLKTSIQAVEKSRVEDEIPENGGIYNITDFTQLGENFPDDEQAYLSDIFLIILFQK